MRITTALSAAILCTIRFALADVEFITPAGGSAASPGNIAWTWKDSGSAPSMADLTSYTMDLMAGGDTDDTSMVVANLVPGGTAFSSTAAGQGAVSATQGGSIENAYYLRIISVATEGGQTINFSPRFSIAGMTGAFSAAVAAYLASNPITSTAARPSVNQVMNNKGVGAVSRAEGEGEYDVPYNEQTGPTRYAPMMKQPPTAITQKDTQPLFPPSSVVIATTWLPPAAEAGVQTTLTQSNTHFVSQVENTAAPVAHPDPAMQKFLNRWKD